MKVCFLQNEENSISSKPIRNLIWIWRINKNYFKVNFLEILRVYLVL